MNENDVWVVFKSKLHCILPTGMAKIILVYSRDIAEDTYDFEYY
jgi:hypothetical protein